VDVGLNNGSEGDIVGINVTPFVGNIVGFEVGIIVALVEGRKDGLSVRVSLASIVFVVEGVVVGILLDKGSTLAGDVKGAYVTTLEDTIVFVSSTEVLPDGFEVKVTLEGADAGFVTGFCQTGLCQTGAAPVSVLFW
jgi:hypothetical protein